MNTAVKSRRTTPGTSESGVKFIFPVFLLPGMSVAAETYRLDGRSGRWIPLNDDIGGHEGDSRDLGERHRYGGINDDDLRDPGLDSEEGER